MALLLIIFKVCGYLKIVLIQHINPPSAELFSLILSHEVGSIKPEIPIYKAVETATNVPFEEHIFIDDIHQYAEDTKNAGNIKLIIFKEKYLATPFSSKQKHSLRQSDSIHRNSIFMFFHPKV